MAELTTTMIAARLALCGWTSLAAGALGHPTETPTLQQFRLVEVLTPTPKNDTAQKNLAAEAALTVKFVEQYNGTNLPLSDAINAVVAATRALELKEWSGKDCPTYDRVLPNEHPEEP